MSHLFLHSNHIPAHTKLDEAFRDLFPDKAPKLGYIPSQPDPSRQFFQQKVAWYGQFGITEFCYCDLEEEYDAATVEELLACDAIFLSGGNTFRFLEALQKRGMIPRLQQFVADGGVLIGLSAGSILMSHDISIATIDEDLGGDENYVGLTDFTALGLTNNAFFPHYDEDPEITKRLQHYANEHQMTVYACNDGDGIIIHDDEVTCVGKVWVFEVKSE